MRRSGHSVLPFLLFVGIAVACGRGGTPAPQDVRVHVERVALDAGNVPVLVLEEDRGSRWLPIWIGTAEARSIALQMHEHRPPRPNTHDLARSLIEGLEGEIVRVVVTELRNGTYYATLALRVRGDVVEIDSRPSDAIAIALRAGAPIFVRAGLFDSAGDVDVSDEEGQPIGWDGPRTPAPKTQDAVAL